MPWLTREQIRRNYEDAKETLRLAEEFFTDYYGDSGFALFYGIDLERADKDSNKRRKRLCKNQLGAQLEGYIWRERERFSLPSMDEPE
jgi:hypothetical protein